MRDVETRRSAKAAGRPSADLAPGPQPAPGRRPVVGLVLGPVLLALVLLLPAPAGMTPEAWRTAGVAMLMAVWWISEAVPIPVTALLPLALLPALGVAGVDAAAAPYANPVIFLFMGGFMLAQAMQRWNLHRRIALTIIGFFGTRPTSLVGGFMLASATLSMWVSNTATAIMLLPVAISVVHLANRVGGGGTGGDRIPGAGTGPASGGPVPGAGTGGTGGDRIPGPGTGPAPEMGVALMLGIAYGASIGGVGTLIGTPPNALFAGFMAETYGFQVDFVRWMMVGVPVVVVSLPLAWLVLTRWSCRVPTGPDPDTAAVVRREIDALPRPSRGEWMVFGVFCLTALAWITRPLLERRVPGLSDAGIAIAAAILLFALPVDLRRREFVLNWDWARRIPWDILVLFGGGLSLAAAISRTGLAEWIGHALAGVGAFPTIAIILVITAVMVFLTELTSNTASTAAFLPVIAALAIGIGENPLLLAIPAVLGASCAFMLPVATPPNAIVFGSGLLTIPRMARAGIWMNLVMILVLTVLAYTLLMLVFGVRPGAIPGWAG